MTPSMLSPLMHRFRSWSSVFVLAACATAHGSEVKFSSGPHHVALIELFTSEGCSSCPPAEAWLNQLRSDPRLWKDFVPVAFHVNYWDRLGWRDKLASKEFTQREYAYAEAWHADSVYTPCFVRDGLEWRSHDLASSDTSSTGVLDVVHRDDGKVSATFRPAAAVKAASFEVHVALLAGGISADIKAGENSGRTLEHEFATVALTSAHLAQTEDGSFSATIAASTSLQVTAKRRALAAWVTRAGDLISLQALGGWLE